MVLVLPELVDSLVCSCGSNAVSQAAVVNGSVRHGVRQIRRMSFLLGVTCVVCEQRRVRVKVGLASTLWRLPVMLCQTAGQAGGH